MTENFDATFRAYIACALWSSVGDAGEPLDAYDADDIAPATLAEQRAELADFVASNASDLAGLDAEQVGRDFWLTRNRHGAGFWDRGLGEPGDRLSDVARVWGGVDLYVGDDGLIYS